MDSAKAGRQKRLLEHVVGRTQSNTWRMSDHKGWGNHMGWFDWDKRRLSGHTTPHPKTGDELLAEMKSGKTARFRFVKVDPCRDPPDMWFATVEDMHYEPSTPSNTFTVKTFSVMGEP